VSAPGCVAVGAGVSATGACDPMGGTQVSGRPSEKTEKVPIGTFSNEAHPISLKQAAKMMNVWVRDVAVTDPHLDFNRLLKTST
jgi:hypothetical protein